MEPEVYLRHIENEEAHWWFKARREILNIQIKKYTLKINRTGKWQNPYMR